MAQSIDWYFDFISPFAYLQFERLGEFALPVRLKPVLFAGLLKHHGQLGPAEIEPKRAFTYRFATWSARRQGIALRFPPAHPFNPLPPLRLCVACGASVEVTRTIFRFIWATGGDPANEWSELCRRLGVDERKGSAMISDPAVKQALVENTAQAVSQGVFGVPTLVIDERCFWGVDATEMAADYLADPAAFEDAEMTRVSQLPAAIQRSR